MARGLVETPPSATDGSAIIQVQYYGNEPLLLMHMEWARAYDAFKIFSTADFFPPCWHCEVVKQFVHLGKTSGLVIANESIITAVDKGDSQVASMYLTSC